MAISSIHIALIDGTRHEVHESAFDAAKPAHEVIHALWRRIDNVGNVPLTPLVVREGDGPWTVAHFGPSAIGGIFAEDPSAVSVS